MLEFLTLKNLDMSDVRRKKHNIAGIINSPVLTFKYKGIKNWYESNKVTEQRMVPVLTFCFLI